MSKKIEIKEPWLKMTQHGIEIISEEVSEKLEKKKLSPSAITALDQCPAQWLANSFVLPHIVENEPDNAARRGSLFHKVMEDFFELDGDERTKEAMRDLVTKTLLSEEFVDLSQNRDVIQWLRGAVNGYYNMKADVAPEDVVIAELELDGETRKGLEVFVTGKIGDTRRNTLGFVDRITKDENGEDSVIVEDWKSGAKAKHWNPKTKSTDGLAEQRQQIIYAILLEQQDIDVSSARLIYPVAREIVDVDLSDKKLRQRVIDNVEKADSQLDLHIENNLFEYGPTFLCNWCPLISICPVGVGPRKVQKALDARAKAPSKEILTKGIQLYSRF